MTSEEKRQHFVANCGKGQKEQLVKRLQGRVSRAIVFKALANDCEFKPVKQQIVLDEAIKLL